MFRARRPRGCVVVDCSVVALLLMRKTVNMARKCMFFVHFFMWLSVVDSASQKPNIIIMMMDDVSQYLFGNPLSSYQSLINHIQFIHGVFLHHHDHDHDDLHVLNYLSYLFIIHKYLRQFRYSYWWGAGHVGVYKPFFMTSKKC